MNKLYLFLILIGFVNVAILVVGIHIIQEFQDFKEIASLHKQIYDLDQKLYKSILTETKTLENIYADHKSIMDRIANHYDQITEQYKKIGEITNEYRKLCKECVDRYGDAYEQFKLCTDKLDRIFTSTVCSYGAEKVSIDEPIGGFHDD